MNSQAQHPAPASGPPPAPAPGTGADAVATVTGATPAPAAAQPFHTPAHARNPGEDCDWQAIRAQAVSGAPTASLARNHGVSQRAIQRRAERDNWPTPERIRRRERQNWKRANGRHLAGDLEPSNGRSDATRSMLPAVRNMEVSLAGGPVCEAVGNTVASLIRESLGTLEPPRTWAQLTQAYGLYRQAKGLDRPQPKNNGRVLIQVGAARARISEARPVIDVPNGEG